MIAQGKSIAHGARAIGYATGKDRAQIVKVNGLDPDDAQENYWSHMLLFQKMKQAERCATKRITRRALRFEVSPENKYTEGWTLLDWQMLAEDFLEEMDRINRRPCKDYDRRIALKPTNLCNSQYVAVVHHDSKSGIRHLHILVNRVDMNGDTNDAHFIGERAARAANMLSWRYHWDDAETRRRENIDKIYDDCISVLSKLPQFSWADYMSRLTAMGYNVKIKKDSAGKVRGYSIRKGNSIYKSSELGHGRRLMPSKIEDTWQSLRKAKLEASSNVQSQKTNVTVKPLDKPQQQQAPAVRKPIERAPQVPKPFTATYAVDGKNYTVSIPRHLFKTLIDALPSTEQVIDDGVKHTDVIKVTALLFMGYIDAATSMSESVGGGGGPGSGWGKRDNEDDKAWIRRCVQQAHWMCKPIRGYRRGV